MSISLYSYYGGILGCDPELFVVREAGKRTKRIAAVASEDVIPAEGIYVKDWIQPWSSCVTRDGVQAELHAGGVGGCRQGLACYIGTAVRELNSAVLRVREAKKDPTIRVSFQSMIKLTKGDLAKLSPEAKELNCKPSRNAYGREPVIKDGAVYPIRSASGHLHLGTPLLSGQMVDPDLAVRVFDVLVGIPGVMVDQDPNQAIRRETYGRAGEYRLPAHGLEYRVPSNFWLKDYKLMSFVFGMAKTALGVCDGLTKSGHANSKQCYETLMAKVNSDKVERAINGNDLKLAWEIYRESIVPFAQMLSPRYGLYATNLGQFEYLVDSITADGLGKWFNLADEAIVGRWTSLSTATGWEKFLTYDVAAAMRKNTLIDLATPADLKIAA